MAGGFIIRVLQVSARVAIPNPVMPLEETEVTRNISIEISQPDTPEGFERFCADIYAEVFASCLPAGYGRRGQAQHGVDIFFDQVGSRRIAVQCKRYVRAPLTQKILIDELKALDEGGARVDLFIVATTALNDKSLLRFSQVLTDTRAKEGKCGVHIDFWNDLRNHVFRHPRLRRDYAPTTAAGMLEEFREAHEENIARTTRIEEILCELLTSNRERPNSADGSPSRIKDVHGRYLLKATRTYVRTEPLMNIGKIRPIAIAASGTGLVLFYCAAFAPIFKLPPAAGIAFVGLGMVLVGLLLVQTCNPLRRRGITYALPLLREMLLEADRSGNVFVTRICAVCPFCSLEMRYRFLGSWRYGVYPRLVCDREPSMHSMDFDYTTLDEPGTDVPFTTKGTSSQA